MNTPFDDLIPAFFAARSHTFAPAYDPGPTELHDSGGLCGLTQVTADSGGGFDIEDMLVKINEPNVGTASGGSSMTHTDTGTSFTGRADFGDNAWDELGLPSTATAIYQCSATQRFTVTNANISDFLDDVADDVGTVRVLDITGHRVNDPSSSIKGLVLIEAFQSTGSGTGKRTIHQIIPAGMALPPNGPMNVSVATTGESGSTLRDRLDDWTDELATGEGARYQHCSCDTKEVGSTFSASDLIAPSSPSSPGYTGIVAE
ncbi:MAG: hypothetical protein H6741_32450 [Alphaproteobacteria bacterium]|nr:hypothetical protein [Alphaproteobacteria bacterium]MCB9797426.1 hypothetical protein [Alphaproteobacteria bacterium]